MSTDNTEHNRNKKAKPRIVNISKIPKIIIEGDEANSIAKRSNIIAIVAVVVSVLVFIATLLVFNQSTQQTIAALKADSIAQDALNTSKKYNDSVTKEQKISNKKIDSLNNVHEIRATNVWRLQAATFKQTQNEFESINAPYLQVKFAYINAPIVTNKQIDVNIRIVNIGNFPAQVLGTKTGCTVSKNPPDFKMLDTVKYHESSSNYYIKDDKDTLENNMRILGVYSKITQQQYNEIIAEKAYVYVFGIIKYKNLGTNRLRIYRYTIQIREIHLSGGYDVGYNYNHNENYDLK